MGGLLSSSSNEYKSPTYRKNERASYQYQTDYDYTVHALAHNLTQSERSHSSARGSTTFNRSEPSNPPMRESWTMNQSVYGGAGAGGDRSTNSSISTSDESDLDMETLRIATSLSILRGDEPSIDNYLLQVERKLGRRIESKSLHNTGISSGTHNGNFDSSWESRNSLWSAKGNHNTEKLNSLEKIEPITKTNVINKIYPVQALDISFIECDEHSDIYRQICKNQGAFYRPRRTLTVISVHLVKNNHLEILYNLKKADLKNIYGKRMIERKMFHSASFTKIRAICNENFNYRLSGTSRGHKYGHGISFSPKFAYANYFSDKSSRVKTMLQCKVLFAQAHIGDPDTIVPLGGYDSTMRENGKVVVKYDDDVFLPEYLIQYTLT